MLAALEDMEHLKRLAKAQQGYTAVAGTEMVARTGQPASAGPLHNGDLPSCSTALVCARDARAVQTPPSLHCVCAFANLIARNTQKQPAQVTQQHLCGAWDGPSPPALRAIPTSLLEGTCTNAALSSALMRCMPPA